jgi:pilus assembly protein Flp/PilA
MQDLLLNVYVKMQGLKDSLITDERGQDLIEYALVVALIALAATAGMRTLAGNINNAFSSVGTKLSGYTT